MGCRRHFVSDQCGGIILPWSIFRVVFFVVDAYARVAFYLIAIGLCLTVLALAGKSRRAE